MECHRWSELKLPCVRLSTEEVISSNMSVTFSLSQNEQHSKKKAGKPWNNTNLQWVTWIPSLSSSCVCLSSFWSDCQSLRGDLVCISGGTGGGGSFLDRRMFWRWTGEASPCSRHVHGLQARTHHGQLLLRTFAFVHGLALEAFSAFHWYTRPL